MSKHWSKVLVILFVFLLGCSETQKEGSPTVRLEDKNGHEYIGEVLDSLKHGQGKMIYNWGGAYAYVYEGFWKNDLRDGKGEIVPLHKGRRWKLTGEFTQGSIANAVLVDTCSDEKIIKAFFKNDKISPTPSLFSISDTIHSGGDYIASLINKPVCDIRLSILNKNLEESFITQDTLVIPNNTNLTDKVIEENIRVGILYYIPSLGDTGYVLNKTYYILPEDD